MVNLSDRQRMRQELVAVGFAWEYIDSGEETFPVGSSIKGVPGSPDYVLKKARLGMFPFLPSDTCECRWCKARSVNVEIPTEPKKVEPQETVMCQECGEEVSAVTKAGALSRLRVHTKSHQGTE